MRHCHEFLLLIIGLALLGCSVEASIPTPTSTPIWVVITVTPSPTPYPTSTPYPTYTPMPTYTPQPTPTITPVIRPIAVWEREDIIGVYTDLKKDRESTLNRYVTQRIKVRGIHYHTINDITWLTWPTTVGEERDVNYRLVCRHLNPSKPLLGKLKESNLETIEVEGDVYKIKVNVESISDYFSIDLTNCIVYLPRYRTPIDAEK